MSELNPTQVEKIEAEIGKLAEQYKQRHSRNFWTNSILIGFVIASGTAITILGLLGHGFWAGILGIVVTAFTIIQQASAVGEKAEFQRTIFTEAENLKTLMIFVKDEAGFRNLTDQLIALRIRAATNLPLGSDLKSIVDAYLSKDTPTS